VSGEFPGPLSDDRIGPAVRRDGVQSQIQVDAHGDVLVVGEEPAGVADSRFQQQPVPGGVALVVAKCTTWISSGGATFRSHDAESPHTLSV
jgi:hypothetical protein